MGKSDAAGDRKQRRMAQAVAEFRRRTESGEEVDVDQYAAHFPEMADDLRAVLHLDSLRSPAAEVQPLSDSLDFESAERIDTSIGSRVDSVSDQAPNEASLPEQFGRYRIIRQLGRGGMGAVYLGEDTQLGRQVALKIPSFSGVDQERALKRFYREARAAATLNHPNICPVYDVGVIDDTHFISMAFIAGQPLSVLVDADKPLEQRQVALLVRKLAKALSHAHQAGIVHRDLKPANIMLNDRGEPVIMDFGLARHLSESDSIRMTQSGALLGTPAYMSPEQVEGEIEKIGPTTDVYSLGIILYELLTGRLPFQGSIGSVLAQTVTKSPDRLIKHRPDLDSRLESLCMQMIGKQHDARVPSMDHVADRLRDFLKSPSPARSRSDKAQNSRDSSPSQTAAQTAELFDEAKEWAGEHDYARAVDTLEQIPKPSRSSQIASFLVDMQRRRDEATALQDDRRIEIPAAPV